jgi:hypothetical protein
MQMTVDPYNSSGTEKFLLPSMFAVPFLYLDIIRNTDTSVLQVPTVFDTVTCYVGS